MISLGKSKVVSMDDLSKYKAPSATDSYCPIAHDTFVSQIMEMSGRMLGMEGCEFIDLTCGVSLGTDDNKEGEKLFGVARYRSALCEDMSLAIGFRNSYDKSLSAGILIGASVFVCDNLCFSACKDGLRILRKHTKNASMDIRKDLIDGLYSSTEAFKQIIDDTNLMKQVNIDLHRGFEMLGLMYGQRVITPTIAGEAFRQWTNPPEYFSDQTAWSFYNACTEALKKTPMHTIHKAYSNVHSFVMNNMKFGKLLGKKEEEVFADPFVV